MHLKLALIQIDRRFNIFDTSRMEPIKKDKHTQKPSKSVIKRRTIIHSSSFVALSDIIRLTGNRFWMAPVVSSVLLPAHAQASEVNSLACPTETSNDIIVTAGNIQIYRAGDGAGIWWSTIGPVPAGHVAFNLLPTVFGTLPFDTIVWEVSFNNGQSFSDISSVGITNGQTVINQETSGTSGPTPAVPDTENQSDLIFRVTIDRPKCMDNIRRAVTFNIIATDLFIAQNNTPVPQFAQSWAISYTSLDANLNPMGAPTNLPTLSA